MFKVYAADAPPELGEMFSVVDSVIDKIVPVAVLLCVGMFIAGGYMWMMSGGNPEGKQKAQGTMTWAAIGFIFVFLAKAILSIVTNFVSS